VQAVEFAFSGKKIFSLGQKSLCSNQDIPPSIDAVHMRRLPAEYKSGRSDILNLLVSSRENMAGSGYSADSPGVPMPI
jgi:hypothetical protein